MIISGKIYVCLFHKEKDKTKKSVSTWIQFDDVSSRRLSASFEND